MITFRFYVVSTVAFFLALAVGVVIGSALDERIVEGLQGRVERVEDDLDNTLESIDAKDEAIDQLQAYVEQSAPFAVEGQIDGAELLVVAEDGVDGASVERLVARGRQGGASVEGIVWLDPAWELDEDAAVDELLALTETEADTPELVRGEVWDEVLTEVAAGLELDLPQVPPDESSSTTTVTGQATTTTEASTTTTGEASSTSALGGALLEDLGESAFLRVQAVESEDVVSRPVDHLLVVFVTGTSSGFTSPGTVVTELARHQVELGVPTVVASVWEQQDEGPDRGEDLALIRDDDALSMQISTVDDLDLIAGRVASVLGLADAREGLVGHYGYGVGADSVLPPWLGP